MKKQLNKCAKETIFMNNNVNNEWMALFNKQVDHIQLEFDSFLKPGALRDYFEIKQDENTGMPVLELCSNKELPKEIANALTQAFIYTKPEQTNNNI